MSNEIRSMVKQYDPSCPSHLVGAITKAWNQWFPQRSHDVQMWLLSGVTEPEYAAYLDERGVKAAEFLVFADEITLWSGGAIADLRDFKVGAVERAYRKWQQSALPADVAEEIVEGRFE